MSAPLSEGERHMGVKHEWRWDELTDDERAELIAIQDEAIGWELVLTGQV